MQSADEGMTLIEVLAAVSIGTLVTLAASMLMITGLRNYADIHYSTQITSDSANIYWIMEKIAQDSSSAGTENLQPNGNADTVTMGPTTGASILIVAIPNSAISSLLQGIAPASSVVYKQWETTGDIAIGVVPVNGRPELCLVPAGVAFSPTQGVYPQVSEVYPLFNGESNFSGTTFDVYSNANANPAPKVIWSSFTILLNRSLYETSTKLSTPYVQTLGQITYTYMCGSSLY